MPPHTDGIANFTLRRLNPRTPRRLSRWVVEGCKATISVRLSWYVESMVICDAVLAKAWDKVYGYRRLGVVGAQSKCDIPLFNGILD